MIIGGDGPHDLTLLEVLHVRAQAFRGIAASTGGADAVAESGLHKLGREAAEYASDHPEELAEAERQVAMFGPLINEDQ